MAANEFNPDLTISLTDHIHQVEQRIVLRRQHINRNASKLRRDIRQRLVAPTTLLTSAGLGFAIGLMLRPIATVAAINTARAHPGRVTRLFANVLKVIAMARTLAAALPPATSSHTTPEL